MEFLKLTQEQFDRLPKSAQQEIEMLLGKVESSQRRIDELTAATGAEERRVGYTQSLKDKTVLRLGLDGLVFPMGCEVEFGTGDATIECRVKGNRLTIRSGSVGALNIKPNMANSIDVWVGDY